MATKKKTVLVSGSSRGLGLAFVEHYIEQGWTVLAATRNVDTAVEVQLFRPVSLHV